ncbi:MAG: hypothetical protein K0S01_1441 [Herbinix sp.]|jgi:hypothetical protein|nr:hypothetical protein [Herbinix sp.]
MNIEEAVAKCKDSGLEGIELIEFAQRIVNTHMKYSYSNSFDFPSKAFEKGYGYCWHQASTLNRILKNLRIESKLVYATENIIPEKVYEGFVVKEHSSGHVWCRVRYAGEEKDVCPGNINNRFGLVHFRTISKIKDWNLWICFWSYLVSAPINYKRLKEINNRQ